MDINLEFKEVKPETALAEFVDSFWMVHSTSELEKEVVGFPDGRIDLIFSRSDAEPFNVMVIGLNTQPDKAVIAPGTLMFAVSFKLLAMEYILGVSFTGLADQVKFLPDGFWNFGAGILDDFDAFCYKVSEKIHTLLPEKIDERKRKLLSLIYSSKGEMRVEALSSEVSWSARQINRYFTQQFGISLKAYCNILRFRASLDHIVRGDLSPDLNFADQSHFIKEIKKFSGAVPKELFKNQNDRFILLSAIRPS